MKKFNKNMLAHSRNPYFIGINSAIHIHEFVLDLQICRNPYFIGINSAIQTKNLVYTILLKSQSLFYWN